MNRSDRGLGEFVAVAVLLVALGVLLCGTLVVLVRGWPDRGPDDDRLRGAVCSLLDELGADPDRAVEVEACT